MSEEKMEGHSLAMPQKSYGILSESFILKSFLLSDGWGLSGVAYNQPANCITHTKAFWCGLKGSSIYFHTPHQPNERRRRWKSFFSFAYLWALEVKENHFSTINHIFHILCFAAQTIHVVALARNSFFSPIKASSHTCSFFYSSHKTNLSAWTDSWGYLVAKKRQKLVGFKMN